MLEWLIFAMILDALMGEPRVLWSTLPHPAALMGRAVEALDSRLNHSANRRFKGAVALAVLVAGALIVGALISALPDRGLIEGVIAAVLIAQRSLVEHVNAVAAGLRRSLTEGRRAVSMIVGRDPEQLDENAVARAAIESAAENLSDAVVAPLFWFLILGMPGLLLYKMVNTADSMIGHKTEKYVNFGYAAAKLDDLLNWIPARITGFLICLAYLSQKAMNVMVYQADLHRSPNAGWPEAAMAGVLEIALSGPRTYDGEVSDEPYLNPSGRRDLIATDVDDAVKVLFRTVLVVAAILAVPTLLTLLF
ncbi:MAG TPA: adenosylcobinamide-phosphate synthase CbiB [Paracoccaceae bacterium]|nr:adenosylcobinamide-phosphate synthase CbiB [Paracoccaceae bacterium]